MILPYVPARSCAACYLATVVAFLPPTTSAQSRLLTDGADRVLVDHAGTYRFTPLQRLDDGSVAYTSLGTDQQLSGSNGRYTLASSTATRLFVAGNEVVLNHSESALPPTIEQKRPLTDNSSTTYLDALLLTEHGDNSQCPTQCDTQSVPPSEQFSQGPSIPGALTQDVRPASCGSFFTEFASIDRGTQIEVALETADHYAGTTATVRSFPVVDFTGHGEARVVHSRDLTRTSYSGPGSVYERFMADGREIVTGIIEPLAADGFIERSEQGETTRLESNPTPVFVLEVVVQHGVASPTQIAEMQQAAADLMSQHGIVVRIIEIP